MNEPVQPPGQFPADLSLLDDATVRAWRDYWYDMMNSTLEADKRHIYNHNWSRCVNYILERVDQYVEAELNLEKNG